MNVLKLMLFIGLFISLLIIAPVTLATGEVYLVFAFTLLTLIATIMVVFELTKIFKDKDLKEKLEMRKIKSSKSDWKRMDIGPLGISIVFFILFFITIYYASILNWDHESSYPRVEAFKDMYPLNAGLFLFCAILGLTLFIKHFRYQQLTDFESDLNKNDLKRRIYNISKGFEVTDLNQESKQSINGYITICKCKIQNRMDDQSIDLQFRYYHKLSYLKTNLGPINKENLSLADKIKIGSNHQEIG